MMAATKRIASGVMTAALVAVLAGCSGAGSGGSEPGGAGAGAEKGGPRREGESSKAAPKNAVKLIGDGSTAFTGAQPKLPAASAWRRVRSRRSSWCSPGTARGGQPEALLALPRRRQEVRRHHDVLPQRRVSPAGGETRPLQPAAALGRAAPTSASATTGGIRDTLDEVRAAWLDGNEIGTHFNGHFCGPDGGVGTWSVEEWKSEISQAKSFVKNWKTNSGAEERGPAALRLRQGADRRPHPLPGRAEEHGRRGPRHGLPLRLQRRRQPGLAQEEGRRLGHPAPARPVPGRAFETLSMDYNFMVNQSGTTTQGDPSQHEYWGNQMRDGLLQAFDRSYDGNRAPLIIGNHFESWNGGTYMRAIEETIETVCTKEEVRCVSFRQLADWLDAQDPQALAKLPRSASARRPKGAGRPTCPPRPPRPRRAPRGPAARPAARDGGSAVTPVAEPLPDGLGRSRVASRQESSRADGSRRAESSRGSGLRQVVPTAGSGPGRTPSLSTKAGSTWAARSAPVFSLPQLSAFFRWKCTICRV